MAQDKDPGNDGNDQKTSTVPSISLPKGGGAIRGMGEKFAANPVTGTGSMSVTIATSPGRSGFGPELSLSYDSGAGNGLFGFGWSLSLPSITRKTDKGLPQYLDGEESDVFVLSGAEDLVPEFKKDGAGNFIIENGQHVIRQEPHMVDGVTYMVRRYRPRIEGLFARIERWTNTATSEIHWRSITGDNVTTLYGKDNTSRIFDPADANPQHPTRIFSWLICQSYDDKGNAIVYEYQSEDSQRIFEDQQGQSVALANERNRNETSRSANRYLKRIKYGNRTPNRDTATWLATDPAQLNNETWMFEVVFDYGEGHYVEDEPDAEGRDFAQAQIDPPAGSDWPVRQDPFSTYRAGFEVRTYRICRRVLMFHHFPDEGDVGNNCLVRSTDFTYSHEQDASSARNPVYTFLQEITQSGYKREGSGYLKRSLPPVEFEYTQPIVQETIEEVDAESLENLPIGLDGAAYQWTDLHGEGIPGILTEQGGAWFYKRNLSPINAKPGSGAAHVEATFGPIELVAARPNLALADGAQFMDLAGDGQPDLVVMDGPMPGFYEHDGAEGWQPFRPFSARLNRDTRDPNLKFVDMNGDGHADVLISEGDVFVWHASQAEAGFGPAHRVTQVLDEEKGPRLVFADGTQSIYLADLSGDGLTDLARIRNGEVCYWPNLGYGRFGAKVTMDHAPHFDNPDQFDPKRIRLADIDGTGTTDIIYLHRDGVRLYFNQSGNSWSEPQVLHVFPRVDDLVNIVPTDLLGNGTACLVWSSSLPGDARRPMRYVNLMGDKKPHLLVKTVNNLGAETRVEYAPSTKFYLQDKRDGKPWITRLPFPVHVVERVETYDHISRNRFVTRYAYHHGYFDGEEREFRGFGMVEEWDTEEFAALAADGALPGATNLDAASHVPPVLTRTWFHTGIYMGRDHVSDFFAGLLDAHDRGEYYREPAWLDDDEAARKRLLPDTIMPPNLTVEEEREACRALKGMMLRQEVYALDGVGQDADYAYGQPYTVAEQNFTIRGLQPLGDNRHAVFFTHAREAITYHYERNPADPRIQHALTLEVDDFGNVMRTVAVGYGRRQPDNALALTEQVKQAQTLLTCSENDYTNAIDEDDAYRTHMVSENRTYELTGLPVLDQEIRYSFAQLDKAMLDAAAIDYHEQPTANALQKRLVAQVRTRYRPDDLGIAAGSPDALLNPGALELLALGGESYQLALTPEHAALVYGDRVNDAIFAEGGYVHSEDASGQLDANWWIPAGRVFLSPDENHDAGGELNHARNHFYLPRRFRDPFGASTIIDYDDHDLLVMGSTDSVQNVVTARNDYRVLQPDLLTDPNGNRSRAAFDGLGMVAGTAVMGKASETLGDSLAGFEAQLTQAQIDSFFENPSDLLARNLLGNATSRIVYDEARYQRFGADNPPFAATIVRETHVSDLQDGAETKIQVTFAYSDGFGRAIQSKVQAEPEKVNGVAGPLRWVGSGWTIYNNKGKPVKQYEPFFSDLPADDAHKFEFERLEGVSPTLFYDPAERVVATLHPNHTWEKVVFDPWQQATWDVNDTMLVADPKTDPDVGDYFARLPADAYLPTWRVTQSAANSSAAEKAAASKTAIHAETPTMAHFDALGRPVLSIAHNKYEREKQDGTFEVFEDKFETRTELDIEGATLVVTDANHREVMIYSVRTPQPNDELVETIGYDVAGNQLYQKSMEAGERRVLNDVAGEPFRAWDNRGHAFRTEYDPLRRPLRSFVTGANPNDLNQTILVERMLYGEQHPAAAARNLRGTVYLSLDQAGVVTNEANDFKGNPLRGTRRLARHYDRTIDWQAVDAALPANPTDTFDAGDLEAAIVGLVEGETFSSSTRYDALNRPIQSIAPHSNRPGTTFNTIQPVYNEANLLERVDVWLNQQIVPDEVIDAAAVVPSLAGVENIDYDAKGQRTRIEYKNGAATTYEYEPETFRLQRMTTTRPPNLNGLATQLFRQTTVVQDLHYTYDPVGNITQISDDALLTLMHRGQQVDPVCRYRYDSTYRLIEAKGREHIDQSAFSFNPPDGNYRDHPFVGAAQINNPQAVRNYSELYEYDPVGNFEKMIHQAADGGWTRSYQYDEASQLEPGKKSNRLTSTTIGARTETYSTDGDGYDAHGNMLSIPHLPLMQWDYRDQLQATSQQVRNNGTPEITWYVYDAAGQRVRKVTERQADAGGIPIRKSERIYLGGFEIYREYDGNGDAVTLERETLHVMDDQQRVVLVETRTDTPAPEQLIRYQLSNHLGSVSLELDGQAQIISYEEYYPYGSTSYQAGRSQAEVQRKRYRYTGMERDEESGLNYHNARYYAPWLARWMSADPKHIGAFLKSGLEPNNFNSSLNLFAPFNLNSVRYLDSNGEEPEDSGNRVASPSNAKKAAAKAGEFIAGEIDPNQTHREEAERIQEAVNRDKRRPADVRKWEPQEPAPTPDEKVKTETDSKNRAKKGGHASGDPKVGKGKKVYWSSKDLAKRIAKGLGPLGTAVSGYEFLTAKTTEEKVQSGTDLVFDLLGYTGIGMPASIAYDAARVVDDAIGISTLLANKSHSLFGSNKVDRDDYRRTFSNSEWRKHETDRHGGVHNWLRAIREGRSSEFPPEVNENIEPNNQLQGAQSHFYGHA